MKGMNSNGQERVELHLHTVFSSMDALMWVNEVIRKAAEYGHPAVAITDFGNIQAYPEAYRAAERYGIKVIFGIECECFNDDPLECFRVVLLVKNNIGKKNLYEMISHYKNQKLCISKQFLTEHREGLLVGSVGYKGELCKAAMTDNGSTLADHRKMIEIAEFYDYIEILPTLDNMVFFGHRIERREQQSLNTQMVQIAKAAGKPFVAAGNVHFLEPEDEIGKKVLLSAKGLNANGRIPLYFRQTGEMLHEFSYLGEQDARNAVVHNTRMIAGNIDEKINPIEGQMCALSLDGAEKTVRSTCLTRAEEIYGSPLPQPVQARLEWELEAIEKNGNSALFAIAEQFVNRSNIAGYPVLLRGCAASSLAAFLLGITEINPLPPHYVCHECKLSMFRVDGKYDNGFDMPDKQCPLCGAEMRKDGFLLSVETFLGLDGDKTPDIDFNVSGEYLPLAVKHLKEMFGETHVLQAGIVRGISASLAFAYTKRYCKEQELHLSKDKLTHIAKKIVGVKCGDGRQPGGYFIASATADALDYSPIWNDEDGYIAHFPEYELYGRLCKLDLLGHNTPTILKELQLAAKNCVTDIPLDDKMTLKTLTSCDTIGIPEFGSRFARRMIEKTKPSCLADFIKISGLQHATGAWEDNAEKLIERGTATISEVIALQDDVMQYLLRRGLNRTDAYQYAHLVRTGRIYAGTDKSNKDWKSILKSKGVETWFLDSAAKIRYLFPKAHAAEYTVRSFQIAWYKTHFPKDFYMIMLNHMSQDGAFTAADFKKSPADIRRELDALSEGAGGDDYSGKRTEALELLFDVYEHGCCPNDLFSIAQRSQ